MGLEISLRSLALPYRLINLVNSIFLALLRSFCVTMFNCDKKGSMSEWLKEADCKSAGYAYVGSNPTRPTVF
jgi:hypothetical protein